MLKLNVPLDPEGTGGLYNVTFIVVDLIFLTMRPPVA